MQKGKEARKEKKKRREAESENSCVKRQKWVMGIRKSASSSILFIFISKGQNHNR